jgi:tetratricopeptide (TPR) repeat protein
MRLFSCLLALCLLLAAAPAFAADTQKEIPFREDSGLTKTEYLLSAGQYSAALDTAGEVLLRHPENADAYTYRGYAYAHLGEKTEAAKNFKKALLINPAHLGANKYLADIYLESGDVSRAIEQLQVIRMTCGHSDCEELRSLERAIDRAKSGEPVAPKKEDKKEEE